MATEKVTCRFAAIVAADMVGCPHVMEEGKKGTIERQMAHRKDLISPKKWVAIARKDGQ